ncbi:MAG TPA: nickel-responsive transcriptional regulator NikR [Methylomirabilota bacterium]|nr:nickel-responsive transcriptional regulator NikR [Methylomirabilota bacterium]
MTSRKAGDRATRFTVSLPAALMGALDRLQSGRRYSSRSEFVRDLLRAELVKDEWQAASGDTVGVLVLVYDHDIRALADKLTHIQHESHDMISATLHIHLDKHTCLEAIPLRGPVSQIQKVANQLLAIKGVRYGQLVPATGQRLH